MQEIRLPITDQEGFELSTHQWMSKSNQLLLPKIISIQCNST